MADIDIREIGLPERCEICHQSDLFDRKTNKCERCWDANVCEIANSLPNNAVPINNCTPSVMNLALELKKKLPIPKPISYRYKRAGFLHYFQREIESVHEASYWKLGGSYNPQMESHQDFYHLNSNLIIHPTLHMKSYSGIISEWSVHFCWYERDSSFRREYEKVSKVFIITRIKVYPLSPINAAFVGANTNVSANVYWGTEGDVEKIKREYPLESEFKRNS